MKRGSSRLWVSILYLFIALQWSFPAQSGWYLDTTGEQICSKICTAPLTEEAAGFIESFDVAYQSLTSADLGVPDKDTVIREGFSEECDDVVQQWFYPIRLERENGTLLAYFSLEDIDQRREMSEIESMYQDLPPDSLYIRTLYVLPTAQRKGLARLMVESIIEEFLPNKTHHYVATRRLNDAACSLYQKCGFQKSKVSLHDLPSQHYASFEKHLQRSKE